MTVEVPIRPWGVEAVASESGTGSESTTVFVGLPPGRSYENPEMLIVVVAEPRAMLIEMAVGDDAYPGSAELEPERSAADLLSASFHHGRSRGRAAGGHFGTSVPAHGPRRGGWPEAERLTHRIRGLVTAIIAVSKPRRRLALGQPRIHPRLGQNAPVVPAQRPPRLGGRRLGARLGRAAGAADRCQGSRPVGGFPERRIRQAQRQRSRDPRGPFARAQHPACRLV